MAASQVAWLDWLSSEEAGRQAGEELHRGRLKKHWSAFFMIGIDTTQLEPESRRIPANVVPVDEFPKVL